MVFTVVDIRWNVYIFTPGENTTASRQHVVWNERSFVGRGTILTQRGQTACLKNIYTIVQVYINLHTTRVNPGSICVTHVYRTWTNLAHKNTMCVACGVKNYRNKCVWVSIMNIFRMEIPWCNGALIVFQCAAEARRTLSYCFLLTKINNPFNCLIFLEYVFSLVDRLDQPCSNRHPPAPTLVSAFAIYRPLGSSFLVFWFLFRSFFIDFWLTGALRLYPTMY